MIGYIENQAFYPRLIPQAPRPVIQRQRDIVINDAQSIHATTVNQTVVESAQRLLNNSQQLILTEIRAFLATLPADDIKTRAAQAALNYLENSSYVEPSTHLNLKSLLILVWQAIHDDQKRLTALPDALDSLVAGLYEIQRGYNIDELGQDDGKLDKAICTKGAFNKLLEKLHGIHADVNISFITRETASLKLPIIVKQELTRYLETFSEAKPQLEQLLDTLSKQGLSSLLSELHPLISKQVMDEFSCIFSQPNQLNDFINTACDVDIQDVIDAFSNKLAESTQQASTSDNLITQQGFFSRAPAVQPAVPLPISPASTCSSDSSASKSHSG